MVICGKFNAVVVYYPSAYVLDCIYLYVCVFMYKQWNFNVCVLRCVGVLKKYTKLFISLLLFRFLFLFCVFLCFSDSPLDFNSFLFVCWCFISLNILVYLLITFLFTVVGVIVVISLFVFFIIFRSFWWLWEFAELVGFQIFLWFFFRFMCKNFLFNYTMSPS